MCSHMYYRRVNIICTTEAYYDVRSINFARDRAYDQRHEVPSSCFSLQLGPNEAAVFKNGK